MTATPPHNQQPTSLAALQEDVVFLKNYLALPLRTRYIAARHWAGVVKNSADSLERKTGMVKIYEDYVATTEDIGFFYFALKLLGRFPRGIREHCLTFNLTPEREQEWERDLAAIPSGDHFLSGLDVPTLDELSQISEIALDRPVMVSVLRKTTNFLTASAAARRIGERLLVQAYNKIKHGMMIGEDGDALVFTMRNRQSRLAVESGTADQLVRAIAELRRGTGICIIFLLQAMALGAFNRGVYGLTPTEQLTLGESFADMPDITLGDEGGAV